MAIGLLAPFLANQTEIGSQSSSQGPKLRVPSGDADGNPLPTGAVARLGSLRLRHEWDVRSVAFSPDGKKIASVSEHEDTIRIWDRATGALIHKFRAPGIFTTGDFFGRADCTCAFTPDGKSIAAGAGSDVCFWDIQTRKEIKRFRSKCKGITALTFASDKRTFYCGGSDSKLYQWEIATGKLVRSWDYFAGDQPRTFANGFKEKTANVKAVSPDGKTVAWQITHWRDEGMGRSAKTSFLIVWDISTAKDLCRVTDLDGKDFFDAQVVFSTDSKYLTARGGNSAMNIRDSRTGNRIKAMIGGGYIDAVAYSPDGRYVAAFARERGLCLWNLATGAEIWRDPVMPWYAHGWHMTLTFAPDGKTVALTSGTNVLLWDVASGKSVPALDGHRWPIRTLHFSRNGTLISADYASVCEWNSAFRQTKKHSLIEYHGHTLSSAEARDANLRIFQPQNGPPQLREFISDKLLHEFAVLPGKYNHGRFSADGRIAALVRAHSSEIAILDVVARKLLTTLKVVKQPEGSLALSADGKLLAVAHEDQTIDLIDTIRGKLLRRLGTPRPTPGKEPRS
jgi:WD40 repeat protein